jgi:uncharacterized protein YndB with AHSA1/START domain
MNHWRFTSTSARANWAKVSLVQSTAMRTSISTVTIKAAPEVVWAALTVPAHVARWQFGSLLETEWRVGGPLRFTSEWKGQTFEQWGTVLSFDEPTRLDYSLFAPRPGLADVPENYFTMTYELAYEGDTTTVTITQADPRVDDEPDGGGEDESADDNQVLLALRDVAESIAGD